MGANNSQDEAFSKFDKLVSPSTIRRAQLHYLRVFGNCPSGEAGRRPFGSSGCVITVAAGSAHSLAVLADGQVYSWGSNAAGQLGHGTQGSRVVTVPCKVPLVKTVVVRVAAGVAHSLVVTETGQLFSWGQGNEGQLGYEVRSARCQLTPRQVMGLNDELADEVACGGEFSAVLTVSGRVLTFGCGKWGALGQGALGSSSRPMPIMGAEGRRFLHISAGLCHCLALTQEGDVFEWGNQYYALDNKLDIVRTAQQVALLMPAVSVACGGDHSVALCRQGYAENSAIYTWGCNHQGQLGYFYSDADNTHREPLRVEGVQGVPEQVAAGKAFTAVLMLSGEIYGWGSNSSSQFGSQPFLQAPTPVVVAPKTEQKAASLTAGPEHLLLLFQADYSYSCQTFLEGLGPSDAASFVYASFARPED